MAKRRRFERNEAGNGHFQTYVFWPKNVGLKNEAIFGIPIVFYGFWVVAGGDALGGGPIEPVRGEPCQWEGD